MLSVGKIPLVGALGTLVGVCVPVDIVVMRPRMLLDVLISEFRPLEKT